MKIILLKLTLLFLVAGSVIAQQQNIPTDPRTLRAKLDSLGKIDYLNCKYKYLNDDLNIRIDSATFDNTASKFGFFKDRIRNFKDSISVLMYLEFDDPDQIRIATNRITYNWGRQGYYTWLNETEAMEHALSFEITHPWRMREFLIDEKNDNPKVIAFLEDLKDKVKKETKRDDLDQLSRKDLLTVAMRCNPQRIADYEKMVAERKRQREAYLKEHGEIDPSKIGVGCGKENCCQGSAKK